MLEELSLTLPRFRAYEQTIPMNNDLETSLLAVYTEVICFYARTIHFFRSRKNSESPCLDYSAPMSQHAHINSPFASEFMVGIPRRFQQDRPANQTIINHRRARGGTYEDAS